MATVSTTSSDNYRPCESDIFEDELGDVWFFGRDDNCVRLYNRSGIPGGSNLGTDGRTFEDFNAGEGGIPGPYKFLAEVQR